MQEIQWTFLDKTGWGEGPWTNEPDKAQWTDPATRLPCMIHRNEHGRWCGYVGVDSCHPSYEKSFEEVEVQMHWGLTYGAKCDPKFDPETGEGICHVPERGEPEDVHWFGFGCVHAFDLSTALPENMRGRGVFSDDIYRDMEYVRRQCTELARQLAQQMSV
jgi:hypothetical protein